ncbi:hypothetical protein AAVH_26423 [Aphelenchoides avenae]|nr:hypothetical protein AAVH_26423 [Aphelenchus avenae]
MVELCEYREWILYDDDIDCEMRAARLECEKLPDCRLVLGDRDTRVTKKRASVIDFREICGNIVWDAKDGSTSIAETLAQSSLTDSSAEDAPEPFIASNSCQKINASIGICLTNSRFKVLNVAFDSLWAPTNADDEDSYKEFFRQGRVYLIGTRHFDKDW